MYCVFVTIQVKPEFIEPFIAACEANHQGTLTEPGALRFDVLRDASDETRFYLYEVYQDEAAFAAHQQTAHYFAWRDTVADWMAAPRTAVKTHSLFPQPWA